MAQAESGSGGRYRRILSKQFHCFLLVYFRRKFLKWENLTKKATHFEHPAEFRPCSLAITMKVCVSQIWCKYLRECILLSRKYLLFAENNTYFNKFDKYLLLNARVRAAFQEHRIKLQIRMGNDFSSDEFEIDGSTHAKWLQITFNSSYE